MYNQDENRRAAYHELCTSYRAIDDFRAKLLGYLPLATAGGVVVLLRDTQSLESLSKQTQDFLIVTGFFGFLITLGLFSFEIYGIRKCGALIRAGQKLEESLQLDNGQFMSRPQNVARVINEPFAAGVIYPAVLAAWMFLALHFACPQQRNCISILCFVTGFVGTLMYDFYLRNFALETHHP